MKNLNLLFASLLLAMSTQFTHAQSVLRGKVVDEVDKLNLQNASVVLLQSKDSILVNFTRTDADGRFTLPKPDSLDLLLLVSYPKFGDHSRLIPKGGGDVDLGEVGLTGIEHLIEEVLVTGRIPVVIKGDTVEYDAGSFTVEKNAKVEDLLKVLPGITVDASGKITAHGKTVEKVLVDGEEFFGDDPTLVTRNIRSDMVDKVQVYEKRSEAAERTGVDDGERIQTINVKLKEDAKNGMFGKLEGALGNDKFYFGKAAAHKFKGSQKIGAYVLRSNDGQVNLGWNDEERFGFSTMETSDEGYIYVSGDDFANWDGRGRPSALNTGISFQDRYKEGKHKINLNYKYGRIDNNIESSSQSQQNLADTSFNQGNMAWETRESLRHRLNARYDVNIDSLTTLTVRSSGSQDHSDFNERSEASSFMNGEKQNSNERSLYGDNRTSNFTFDGLITRKLKKAGRSVALRMVGNLSESDRDAFLDSRTDVYNTDNDPLRTLIEQRKDDHRTSGNFGTTATYTEPLSNSWRTSLEYQFNINKSHSINNSYNRDAEGNYTVLDEEFSNDFNFDNKRNGVNLFVGYKAEKIEFNINNRVRHDGLQQRNNYGGNELSRSFTTYNPGLHFRYNISRSKSFRFSYDRSNSLPSLNQIQPLRQNVDPLNQQVGNEELRPAKRDNYVINFNSFEMLKNQYLFGHISFSQDRDAIQQNVVIDDNGVRTFFFDNISSHVNNSGSAWIGGGQMLIKSMGINARYGGNGNISRSYNFLNGNLNRNNNIDFAVDVGAEKSTTKGVDFDFTVSPGWRRIESSLQPEFNSSGFVTHAWFNFRWFLPGKFQLFGQGSYLYEAPTKVFDEKFERLLFRPGISRKFLKNESLVAEVYVNDVFNQNVGFRRYQSAGRIIQDNYNTISRFFMFKVSWDFTTMNGGGQ